MWKKGVFEMDYKEMNKAVNWRLHVFEQKKTENAVVMNCSLSGKKKNDGTYGKAMNIRVVIGCNTKWDKIDYSGKNILVTGGFMHDTRESDGKEYLSFTIFAETISEYIYEAKKETPEWS